MSSTPGLHLWVQNLCEIYLGFLVKDQKAHGFLKVTYYKKPTRKINMNVTYVELGVNEDNTKQRPSPRWFSWPAPHLDILPLLVCCVVPSQHILLPPPTRSLCQNCLSFGWCLDDSTASVCRILVASSSSLWRNALSVSMHKSECRS